MDKQIIIDGVDVADCEHINACDKKMKCVILQDDVCETNPYCEGFDCYYKQLKRKEQELQEAIDNYVKLDNEAQNLFTEKTNLDFEVKDLRQQLDQLKQSLTEIKGIVEMENNDIKVLYNRRTYQRMKKIIQKISEVLND